MRDLISRRALDKALMLAAANDKSKNTRVWAKAICVLHDAPVNPYRIISAAIVAGLAAISAAVLGGLAAGRNMWPWIVAYCAVLTAKNIVDWLGTYRKEDKTK